MADNYFSFTISAQNTNKTAYYGVLFTSPLTVFQGSFLFKPTATTTTQVGTDAMDINLQLPSCSSISGGVSLQTSAANVSGDIFISPALSVPVTFALWGFNQIGSVTVQPGQTQQSFNFDVSGQQGLSASAAQAKVNDVAPKATKSE